MKKEHMQYFAKNMQVLSNRDRVFLNNPVLIQGMGLAPIVVAATNMNNALVLAAAVILLLTPTRIIAAFITKFCNSRFRGIVYTVTAATLYIGVSMLLMLIFGDARIRLVGLYLPLLIVDPLIIRRYVRPQKEKFSIALNKGVLTTVGFLIVLLATAFIRELLGYGTFFGLQVLDFAPLPMASMVAGGFIIVGLFAALWSSFINMFKKHVNMGVKNSL